MGRAGLKIVCQSHCNWAHAGLVSTEWKCSHHVSANKRCLHIWCFPGTAAQEYPETAEDEDEETPNYEEKAQEIVQSILQEVVNTVAGGELCFK